MTTRGKIVFTIILLALIFVGIGRWGKSPKPAGDAGSGESKVATIELAEIKVEVPRLAPPAPATMKDNVLEIELSKYAGYAGLIAANGGLLPNENSVFAKKHGFKVHLRLSEEESWSALNSGKMVASATTADVLAVYGKQFKVSVPVQLGFSRGADGIVVRNDIKKINDLKGKVLAVVQFNESEFFMRYLAQEAGLGIATMSDLNGRPDPNKVNLVFTEEGEQAGELFLRELASGRVAGCVTWEPTITDTVANSGGKAAVLVTNRNLLVIADILVVNRAFAQAEPAKVQALVDGVLEGNQMMTKNPAAQLDIVGKAFGWDRKRTEAELGKVHFSNLPENLAFFSGAINAAGSFGGIYQSAVYAYGSELIKEAVDADEFADLKALKALEQSGKYKDEQLIIKPLKSQNTANVEADPLLTKDIRFLFQPNDFKLDATNKDNVANLDALKRLLQVSPGSTIRLVGHIDGSNYQKLKSQNAPEAELRKFTLWAKELSKSRAETIKQEMMTRFNTEETRLSAVGRGFDEPLGGPPDADRRVVAQWFTIE